MKTKTFKAILIDAKKREVREVTINAQCDIAELNGLIGSQCFCQGFRLGDAYDICLVDDEGLINGTQDCFWYKGTPSPLFGNGLICGGTREGETSDVKVSIDEVRQNVKFMSAASVVALFTLH